MARKEPLQENELRSNGSMQLELMKGPYDPEEAEILLQFLQDLAQAKKRKALSEWLQDHRNSEAPQEKPEVQELERMQKNLQELLARARQEGQYIDLKLEGDFSLAASKEGRP